MRHLRIIIIVISLWARTTSAICVTMPASGPFIPMSTTSYYLRNGACTESATPQMTVAAMPLAARSVTGGMTSEQTMHGFSPRRAIIHDDDDDDGYGDDDLRPGYDPNDPFAVSITETPWFIISILGLWYSAFIAYQRCKKSQA